MGFRKTASVRPIATWRLIGAALFHFSVPLYLVSALIDLVLNPRSLASAGAIAAEILRFTPWFLAGFAACLLVAVLGGMLVDLLFAGGRTRAADSDAAAAARRIAADLHLSLAKNQGVFGSAADALLAKLTAARWDFIDPDQQALARNLREAVDSAARAYAIAPTDRRETIASMTTETLARIAAAHSRLIAARSSDAERQAQTVARYIELRYDPSDFTSGRD